jgi:hypothetical protein
MGDSTAKNSAYGQKIALTAIVDQTNNLPLARTKPAVVPVLSDSLLDADVPGDDSVFGADANGWPAPGLDDTQLSKSSLHLELHRAQITDRRMSASRVVEALDIVKHVCLCFIARPVRFAAGALGLQ